MHGVDPPLLSSSCGGQATPSTCLIAGGAFAQVAKLADGKWNDDPVYQGNVVNYNDRHIWVDIWDNNNGQDYKIWVKEPGGSWE